MRRTGKLLAECGLPVDPTVRKREEGIDGECNYQLAKCIHILSQRDWGCGWTRERVKEVVKWMERDKESG